LATLALYFRQSLLVAYIALGVLIGPYGLKWVEDPQVIKQFSNFGIIFLLFLMGLNLQPQNLLNIIEAPMTTDSTKEKPNQRPISPPNAAKNKALNNVTKVALRSMFNKFCGCRFNPIRNKRKMMPKFENCLMT